MRSIKYRIELTWAFLRSSSFSVTLRLSTLMSSTSSCLDSRFWNRSCIARSLEITPCLCKATTVRFKFKSEVVTYDCSVSKILALRISCACLNSETRICFCRVCSAFILFTSSSFCCSNFSSLFLFYQRWHQKPESFQKEPSASRTYLSSICISCFICLIS